MERWQPAGRLGTEIGDSYYRTDYGEKVSDEVVLSAKNVTVKGQIENLNLDLHKGEILGIGGLSECEALRIILLRKVQAFRVSMAIHHRSYLSDH